MPGSRKSTPSRARSSSVVSNASVASTAATNTTAKSPKSPKAPKAPKAPKSTTPKSPVSKTKELDGTGAPQTPRKSKASEPASTKKLTAAQQAAIASRPALPAKRNPVLPEEDVPVKLQVINREGENIIIGRVKLPTVVGSDHGFLLKRFDTDAIAASSMYRMAFPYASAQDERAEMEYLESRYDVNVANGGVEKVLVGKRGRGRPSKKAQDSSDYVERLPAGSTGVRLQGTWIPCADGIEVAKEYGLHRYALPLIESKAIRSDEGVPILTPSATDKVSTPTSGRGRKMLEKALEGSADSNASPSASRKRAKESNSSQDSSLSAANSSTLSADQVAKQIQDSQALAKSIQVNGAQTPSSSRKRRAVNQSPTSRQNPSDDDNDDYEDGNIVVRSFRRGTRAARRRPIVTTAGAFGAVGAVGAGTVAWLAGGNMDVAIQLVQQSVSNLNIGSWFF